MIFAKSRVFSAKWIAMIWADVQPGVAIMMEGDTVVFIRNNGSTRVH